MLRGKFDGREGDPQDGDSLGELRQVEKAERRKDMSGPAVEAISSARAKRTSISIRDRIVRWQHELASGSGTRVGALSGKNEPALRT